MMSNTRVMSHGVRLNVVSYGDPAAVPVVLLHGYPNSHAVWQEVDAGRWVLVSHPDLVAGWIAGFVAEMEGRAAGVRGGRRPLRGSRARKQGQGPASVAAVRVQLKA